MNNQSKTALMFLGSLIALSYAFYCFTSSIIFGAIIAIFVSICLFYDPKKLAEKKKKDLEAANNNENI